MVGSISVEFLNGISNQPYNGGIIIKTDADEYDGTLGSGKNTTNNYFLHPVFKFGEDNILGFWVTKF